MHSAANGAGARNRCSTRPSLCLCIPEATPFAQHSGNTPWPMQNGGRAGSSMPSSGRSVKAISASGSPFLQSWPARASAQPAVDGGQSRHLRHIRKAIGVVGGGIDSFAQVFANLVFVNIEGGDKFNVSDVIAAQIDVHQPRDKLVFAGIAI